LIGVNTQIYSPSGASAGIGFSIPVDAVKWVVPDLIKYGKINRPIIGVTLATSNITREFGIPGALVLDVDPDGPAGTAGLEPTRRNRLGQIEYGDIILGVNSERVRSNNDLILALEKYQSGDLVELKILRDEKEIKVPVRLGSSDE
jgi:S1-C subfamily serine protease